MTLDERRQWIAIYGSAHPMLLDALERYPREMWQYRPTPEDFTIHEIFVHVTDSEANSYARCRFLIAQPGATVSAYDEVGWSKALAYHARSVTDAVELFRWLRGNTFRLVRDLPDATWEHTVQHPEIGTITMDDWLKTYALHVPEHIAQMERVYQSWLDSIETAAATRTPSHS